MIHSSINTYDTFKVLSNEDSHVWKRKDTEIVFIHLKITNTTKGEDHNDLHSAHFHLHAIISS